MNRSFFCKGIPFILSFLLILPALTFSAERDSIKIQGFVMELNLKKSTLVVNEKMFIWNEKTVFNDEKGSPVKLEKLKAKSWVYIEGENDRANKRWIAKKIYLLPKYIDRKELRLYPFIQKD